MRFHSLLTTIAICAAAATGALLGAQEPAKSGTLANPAAFAERAPDHFKAEFGTSAGVFVVEAHRDWAPNGADRFYNLVKSGFYDDDRFFRVIDGFMVQFGMNGNPQISKVWRDANIKDDPVKGSNKSGMITFAQAGAHTITTT